MGTDGLLTGWCDESVLKACEFIGYVGASNIHLQSCIHHCWILVVKELKQHVEN